MVPLLIGNIGPGAGEGSRLAVGATIFGGMLISTFFTLYVTPTMYVLLTKNTKRIDAIDIQLEKDLLEDKKEIAEHLMLIDLGRNDLGRIAKTGSVNLTDKMFIERYSHVMHIVSNVECELRDSMNSIDVLKATFPAGTLSGAPKVRAMEIIDEIEPVKRNIYSGAIGNLSWHGGMDLAIAIRTAIIKDKILYIQAGAGIVYDSVPESEWQETMDKAQAIIKAAENI